VPRRQIGVCPIALRCLAQTDSARWASHHPCGRGADCGDSAAAQLVKM